MSQKVAFIGLGNMGGPMAGNLAKAGFSVCAFDLVPAALEQAKQAGCTIAATALDAIEGADFIVSMLPNGTIVENTYIGNTNSQGLLANISEQTLVIDCSTVAPHNSHNVAAEAVKYGIQFVDAPVSGGTAGATAGTLAFMCGGDKQDVEKAKTVLNVMGQNIFHAGDHGAGSVAKICNNMLLAIHMIGTAEAIQLGVKNGLDPKVLSDIMLQSSGDNWSLEKYNPCPGVMESAPASNDYQGGFMVKLMQKDLGLALEAASKSQSYTPLGSLASNLFGIHSNGREGNAELDFSSIWRLFNLNS